MADGFSKPVYGRRGCESLSRLLRVPGGEALTVSVDAAEEVLLESEGVKGRSLWE